MAREKSTPEVEEEVTDVPELPEDQKQGEVAVDKDARAEVVGGGRSNAEKDAEVQAQNIEDAKNDALRNHAAEQQA